RPTTSAPPPRPSTASWAGCSACAASRTATTPSPPGTTPTSAPSCGTPRLRRLADPLVSSLYDPPLRAACAVPDPPRWARAGLHLTLRARARLLRWARPRRLPLFADGIVVRSHPDG